ncbi:MAG: hybrid sensor histidine kinase/response regulator [Breznakibacter sp.]
MSSKILIVDDNGKNVQLLASLLTGAGYEIEYALGGKSALQWVGKHDFDAILLDIMMPEMDGFETCTAIKGIAGKENIPIIFITARDDAESINKAFKTGGVDYISKPFNQDELLARLATHVELRKSKKKLQDMAAWLEKEVDNKTKELQEANKRIEKAYNELKTLDVAQNEFLKAISHEIRTPLTAIVGSISLLRNFSDNEDLNEVVALLERSVTKLEHYSYVALQIAYLRIRGKAQLSMEKINLNAILKNCVTKSQALAESRQLILKFTANSPGINVVGDHDMLNKAFMAILESCIKYTGEGIIEVNIDLAPHELKCTFNDYGAQFVNDQPVSGFDSITNSTIAPYGRNTNIELQLAQMIILTHGWHLEFVNKHNEIGTETVVSIPVELVN